MGCLTAADNAQVLALGSESAGVADHDTNGENTTGHPNVFASAAPHDLAFAACARPTRTRSPMRGRLKNTPEE
jgi:hypothetical protein